MAVMLQDQLFPWSAARFPAFLNGPGELHSYMVHVGAGWACTRLPWLRLRINSFIQRFDPLLKWLVIDGFGFQEGYFHPRLRVDSHQIPFGLEGYAMRGFDQGLGRSPWFVYCASVAYISRHNHQISPAPPPRSLEWCRFGLRLCRRSK